jgi:hypothetical protein
LWLTRLLLLEWPSNVLSMVVVVVFVVVVPCILLFDREEEAAAACSMMMLLMLSSMVQDMDGDLITEDLQSVRFFRGEDRDDGADKRGLDRMP